MKERGRHPASENLSINFSPGKTTHVMTDVGFLIYKMRTIIQSSHSC